MNANELKEVLSTAVAADKRHRERYLRGGTCLCGGNGHGCGPHSAVLQALESAAIPAWAGGTEKFFSYSENAPIWEQMRAVLACSPEQRKEILASLLG